MLIFKNITFVARIVNTVSKHMVNTIVQQPKHSVPAYQNKFGCVHTFKFCHAHKPYITVYSGSFLRSDCQDNVLLRRIESNHRKILECSVPHDNRSILCTSFVMLQHIPMPAPRRPAMPLAKTACTVGLDYGKHYCNVVLLIFFK